MPYCVYINKRWRADMKKFDTAAEARAFGAALFAAGKCTAWCDYRSFGKFILRVQVDGTWSNMGRA
jgi:hypothetical protein